MQLEQVVRKINIENINSGKKMTLSATEEAQDHIISLLTEKGYKKPISSTVREWFSNAWDTQKEVEKATDPILVRLFKESNNYIFEVHDKGAGLNVQEFEEYVMTIGNSTRRNSNDFIGAMGAGSKVSLSYSDQFEVKSVKEGIEYKYLVFKGVTRPDYTLISQKETKEENGSIFKLVIKNNWDEKNKWIKAIKEQLCYFENAAIEIDGTILNDYKIYKNELFEWSSLYPLDEMHISLGSINYPISWETIGIDKINVPVAIKIGLDESVRPIFNREELIYTDATKELVVSKIKTIANYFVEVYNNSVKEFDTFLRAFDYLDPSQYFTIIEGKQFCIDSLKEYSEIKLENPKVKGITCKNAGFYKINFAELLWEWSIIGKYSSRGVWKTKRIYESLEKAIFNPKKPVILSNTPTGNVKEYLQQKYGVGTLFIVKCLKRKLKQNSSWNSVNNYVRILGLRKFPKSEWRNHIKEWQNVQKDVISLLNDETSVETTHDYLTWLENKKLQMKENRKRGITTGNYKILDKQSNEVTIAYGRWNKWGTETIFEKSTFNIEKIYKNDFLTVYFDEEEKEIGKKWYPFESKKLKFAVIGKREQNKIKQFHNFKNFKEFKMIKPFQRIASALAIEKLLEMIPDNKEHYITSVFPNWGELYNKIKIYHSQVLSYKRIDADVKDAILEEAKQNNSWDWNIYSDYLEFKKIADMFYFLHLFKDNSYYENEEIKKQRTKLITSLILLEKYKQKEYELVPKIPDSILTEMYVGEEGLMQEVN